MRKLWRWPILAWTIFGCVTAAHGADAEPRGAYFPPDREFRKRVATWRQTTSRNVVLQEMEYTCGAASLATLLRYVYGDPASEREILKAAFDKLSPKEIEDREKNGLSMADLTRGATRLGYLAAVLEVKYDKLKSLPAPVIVRLVNDDFKHFVVYRGELDGIVFLADPIRGNVRMPRHEFLRQWDGNMLAVVKPGQRPPEQHALKISPETLVTPQNLAARRSLFSR